MRKFIPIQPGTHPRLERVKNKMTVERGGIKTTYDDVINKLVDFYWDKGVNK